MKSTLISLILLCILACCATTVAPSSSDQSSLQGVWMAQSESVNGHEWLVNYQYTFSENIFTFTDETGKEMRYTFTLDALADPKLITIRPVDAGANSTPVSIAYELESDLLKIVVAPAGLRPTGISDKNDQELIVCVRKTR